MKDHYKTLGIPPSATQQDVKKAYRSLAFKYHPDKNNGSQLAEAQFRAVQEAYEVLGDTYKRSIYDDERWLSGMGKNDRHQEPVTPTWLLKICRELNASLAIMDRHRMSQGALQAYILLILSDPHLGVLQQYNDVTTNKAIVDELLQAAQWLEAGYLPDIAERLQILSADNDSQVEYIKEVAKNRIQKAQQEKLYPYFVLAITLLLCLFMYLYGRVK